ncbi:MAG: hypothetical protein A2663_01815 [Candidatus Buchananbacteria bacterium RIFCSPHIGHO2_01_FULL_46_12]|uniref:Uncharacterized protein n=3 Tax=Candidatus Buchananiibacteriota TaxID=1817903 RepID=A0A1G1YAS1_9BACT|nr:MAG: hypothetical protein A2663_01815 [Candidatus Buchananbacteria bacterium RIFCSPHIGHO2_01_FULL_46_12]OGY52920.1 MAG: hypothetical protein A3B15_02240 [Candidatus Buchananbacteria bacterium RIFCSPLOWO2_01_FULL_45_31]OGY56858.1 MAG: hypothetical protein A3H67_01935 [Candidatus Buchananbacteria bacterium RIFCSPLOWO2_02_FULL_46_11b]
MLEEDKKKEMATFAELGIDLPPRRIRPDEAEKRAMPPAVKDAWYAEIMAIEKKVREVCALLRQTRNKPMTELPAGVAKKVLANLWQNLNLLEEAERSLNRLGSGRFGRIENCGAKIEEMMSMKEPWTVEDLKKRNDQAGSGN